MGVAKELGMSLRRLQEEVTEEELLLWERLLWSFERRAETMKRLAGAAARLKPSVPMLWWLLLNMIFCFP